MKKMFCPECGSLVEEGNTFCPECGKEIHRSVPASNEPKNPTFTKASGFFWIRLFMAMTGVILIFAILILIVGLTIAINEGETMIFFIGLSVFVAILYTVPISMVFGSMAMNIEKMTNQFAYIQKAQENQLALLKQLSAQHTKGE